MGVTIADRILEFLRTRPGLSDGEINHQLFAGTKQHATININCRWLAVGGYLDRRQRPQGQIGNYPTELGQTVQLPFSGNRAPEPIHHPLVPGGSPQHKMRNDVSACIGRFIATSQAPCHRYLSWDYCFAFLNRRDEIRRYEALKDTATVHLAWFLASWGMLRGSGDLFWKNYKYLVPVVDELMNPQFDGLVGFDPRAHPKEGLLDGLFGHMGIVEAVRRGFMTLDTGFSVSDTMVTKTLLGAMGCSMAYDVNVRNGLSKAGLTYNFGRRSLSAAIDFYLDHQSQFEDAGNLVPHYPPLKLLDMYFFELGAE